MSGEECRTRGQVGIGTLVVFIAMILIATVTVAVLFDVVGGLQSQTSSTSDASSTQLLDRVEPVAITGDNIVDGEEELEIQRVEVIVTKSNSGGSVDLRNVTAQWNSQAGTVNLLNEEVTNDPDQATFGTRTLDDPVGTFPVLTDTSQRFAVVFEPGEAFGDRGLTSGERVNIQLIAAGGGSVTIRFTVPELREGTDSVTLG